MINISICGVGLMGRRHLKVAQNLGCNILSTYDPIHNTSYDDFLTSLTRAQGLIIANPTPIHCKTILDAKSINPDIKILCEKPLADSSTPAFLEKILQYESSILVGQIERFNPVITKLKSLLKDVQSIIQVSTFRVNNVPSRFPCDCRQDIGIHDLDFSVFLLNDFPNGINILSSPTEDHETLSYRINDTQIFNEVSWRYPYKKRLFRILTDAGCYEGDFFLQSLYFHDWRNTREKIHVDAEEPLSLQLLHFIDIINENALPVSKASDNVKMLKLLGY